MKLRNKKTGEIVDTLCSDDITKGISFGIDHHDGNPTMAYYCSLAKLNSDWEDYEEPKGNWTIDPMNENYIDDGRYTAPDELERYEELGLKFNTKEEAEKAVEKLKAWKRLKDKGFRFEGWQDLEACDETERLVTNRIVDGENIIGFRMDDYHDCSEDLNICFGGEE